MFLPSFFSVILSVLAALLTIQHGFRSSKYYLPKKLQLEAKEMKKKKQWLGPFLSSIKVKNYFLILTRVTLHTCAYQRNRIIVTDVFKSTIIPLNLGRAHNAEESFS